MTKLLVETTGDFGLVDPNNAAVINWNRPTVVQDTPFVQQRAAAGQIKVLDNQIPDDVTDEQWVDYYNESFVDGKLDLDLARAAVKSKPEDTPTPPAEDEDKQPRRRGRQPQNNQPDEE